MATINENATKPTARPALLLLPGLLNDARLWQSQREGLDDLAEVIVADLTRQDSIEAMAASVLAQAPERFALAGLSMGGYVAQAMVRQAPERVMGLALLDTSARPDTQAATRARHRMMSLAARDFDAMVNATLRRLLHPAHQRDAGLVAIVRDMAHQVGLDAYRRQQQAIIHRADSRPTLAAIAGPTLVLCGREDAITPCELHEEMAGAIPDAALAVIEQCGHLATLEQPEAVNQALRQWWARVMMAT